jgi:uncharacterized protein (TIGR02118 family)
MIKVIAPAQRHPTNRGLADFHRYWGESHGPVYAHTRNLRGYVQHLTLHEAYGGNPAPTYDGISMFWFDDLDHMDVTTNDPEVGELLAAAITGVPRDPAAPPVTETGTERDVTLFREVMKDDAQLFDRSTSWPMHDKRAVVVAQERVIVDGDTAPEMVKAIFVAAKMPGLTLLEFLHHWEHVHGPLGAELPGLRRYVQNHALPEAYAGGVHTHDGWAELWFDDLASLHAAAESPAWDAMAQDGATLFAQPLGVGVARERIQKDPRGGWAPSDWGVGAMSDDDIRERLAAQGYAALAADPDAPAKLRRAAADEALIVWTGDHLLTIDDSHIDARPGR